MKQRIKGKINKNKFYYFDRLTINFPISENELLAILPLEKLMKNCRPGKIVFPASNTGKHCGYQSKIDAKVCNDKFVRILKRVFRKNELQGNITYIEIACEYVTESWSHAKELQRRFTTRVFRNWSRGRFWTHQGKITFTAYHGTVKGKPSNNYNRSYPRISKVLELEGIEKPCFKIEFPISKTSTVKRVLKIQDIHDLKSPKETFKMLEKRYIKVPKIDKKKVQEIASEYYSGIRKVREIGQEINTYPKLKTWLNELHDEIKRKQHGRRYRLRDIEKKILLEKENYYFASG